jgi:uncharacterized protein YlxP (DUF503 family)
LFLVPIVDADPRWVKPVRLEFVVSRLRDRKKSRRRGTEDLFVFRIFRRAIVRAYTVRAFSWQVMPVAQLTLEVRIEHAHSLKDRRQVVRSLKDQLRQGYNISVAELDEAVAWNSATIGVVALSRSRDYLHGLVEEVERAARRILNEHGAELADSFWEYVES